MQQGRLNLENFDMFHTDWHGTFDKCFALINVFRYTKNLMLKLPKNVDIEKIIDQLVSYYI